MSAVSEASSIGLILGLMADATLAAVAHASGQTAIPVSIAFETIDPTVGVSDALAPEVRIVRQTRTLAFAEARLNALDGSVLLVMSAVYRLSSPNAVGSVSSAV
jgi:hypothetical protein